MGRAVDSADVRRAIERVVWPDSATVSGVSSVHRIEAGINAVFRVRTGDTPAQVTCKFATYSRPSSFRAGVAAIRLLDAHTALPVPEVYWFQPDPPELPAFQVTEWLPGSTLPGSPTPDDTAPVRALGCVIRALASIPETATEGYGPIRESAGPDADRVIAAHDCRDWLVEYGLSLYDDPPAHDRLASAMTDVPAFLRDHRHRFPARPDPSVVVTDFGPGNLLAPDGELDGDTDALTGVIDLERATVGPAAFTAVNAEYLLTRGVEEPEPLVEALYDPLPFGPDVPNRNLYRLLALGRSVHALDLWYEVGSEHHRRRGDTVATAIRDVLN